MLAPYFGQLNRFVTTKVKRLSASLVTNCSSVAFGVPSWMPSLMPRRIVTLELSPAEARALQGALSAYCLLAREQGLGPDELPGFYHRLARVGRLLRDGLDYLHPARSA